MTYWWIAPARGRAALDHQRIAGSGPRAWPTHAAVST